LPPPDFTSAFQPPPPIMACRRVLMVSMGYKAEGRRKVVAHRHSGRLGDMHGP
jgi:hypothetical protein